jgi:threonine/homoserine/homoserine lactone efflux protein
MLENLLAFLAVSILVIITPGPDTALLIRNTLMGGARGGIFTALGIVFGQLIWAFATSLGLVALLIASEPLFLALKYLGAAYLVLLGLQALWAAFRSHEEQIVALRRDSRQLALASFRQGLISDLGNPKMAMFFASLLPQFVPGGEASFIALMSLGALFALLAFLWLSFYALTLARLGQFLRRSTVRRSLEAITGSVLVALGLRLALEER